MDPGHMDPASPQRTRVELIYSADVIAARVDALAAQIAANDSDRLLVIAVLTGSFVFAADLIRGLAKAGLSPEVDFISLSSYRNSRTSSGAVTILRDVEMEVRGRNVLLVDDVLDSGRTLAFAKDLIAARAARRVRTCTLLTKNVKRAVNIHVDFCGFTCPDEFMVGYGMDMAARYRELPFVGRVVRE